MSAVFTATLAVFAILAAAVVDSPKYDGRANGAGVDLLGRDTTPDGRGSPRGPVLISDHGPVVQYVYSYVPACGDNRPGVGSPDSLCIGATVGCPPGSTRYWAYRSLATAEPRAWSRTGQACLGAGTVGADGAEVAIGVTVEDFRRLPLPPATSVVEPPGGRVLINIETNAYARAETVTLPTEVLGQSVAVRATPVAYSWDFGDGTTVGPTADPGAPWPVLGNAHIYTVPGDYAITLTTTYSGEFSVAGGPWLPIDGTATVSSPGQAVTAVSATTQLVAEPLA